MTSRNATEKKEANTTENADRATLASPPLPASLPTQSSTRPRLSPTKDSRLSEPWTCPSTKTNAKSVLNVEDNLENSSTEHQYCDQGNLRKVADTTYPLEATLRNTQTIGGEERQHPLPSSSCISSDLQISRDSLPVCRSIVIPTKEKWVAHYDHFTNPNIHVNHSKDDRNTSSNHSFTDDEGSNSVHAFDDKHSKRSSTPGQDLGQKASIEGSKYVPEMGQIVDSSSTKTILSELHDEESIYCNIVEDKASRLLVKGDAEMENQHEGAIGPCRKNNLPSPPPGFMRMKHLKQKKDAKLRRKNIQPPPGFYRMKELKLQKELAMQQRSTKPTINCRLKPKRKKRSKSSATTSQLNEGIINGKIEDIIPEDFAVYLGSPSQSERAQKFREMFREEQIANTIRRFLF